MKRIGGCAFILCRFFSRDVKPTNGVFQLIFIVLGATDEYLNVSEEVKKSPNDVKRAKVNPSNTYPDLSDIESSGSNTPQLYTPEPPYTDDDNNEQPILGRYLTNSRKNINDDYDDDDEERYFCFCQLHIEFLFILRPL